MKGSPLKEERVKGLRVHHISSCNLSQQGDRDCIAHQFVPCYAVLCCDSPCCAAWTYYSMLCCSLPCCAACPYYRMLILSLVVLCCAYACCCLPWSCCAVMLPMVVLWCASVRCGTCHGCAMLCLHTLWCLSWLCCVVIHLAMLCWASPTLSCVGVPSVSPVLCSLPVLTTLALCYL